MRWYEWQKSGIRGKDEKERVKKDEECAMGLPNFYLYMSSAELCNYLKLQGYTRIQGDVEYIRNQHTRIHKGWL